MLCKQIQQNKIQTVRGVAYLRRILTAIRAEFELRPASRTIQLNAIESNN